jgi:thioredoxin-related protein
MYFTKKLLFIFIFFGCFTFNAQESERKKVLNIFTFKEAEKLLQLKSKPILVFLYTDWCKICHGMKKTTFKNKKVIQLLNENFYLIMLNGEEKKNITFLGRTFMYKPSGNSGIHELANELATIEKRISYPTTTILNTKLEISLQLIGFLNSKKMMDTLLKYQQVNYFSQTLGCLDLNPKLYTKPTELIK